MKKKKQSKLYEWQGRCKSGQLMCACGEKRFLTVDHIIPVSLLEQFLVGDQELPYEWEDNFEVLCKWCNFEKRNRLFIRHPKFFKLFRELLDKAENELRPKKTETISEIRV